MPSVYQPSLYTQSQISVPRGSCIKFLSILVTLFFFSPFIHLSFLSYSHSSALLFISPPLFSLILLSFLASSPLSCASTPLPLPLPFRFVILSKRRSHFSSSSPCDAGASPLAAGPPPPPGAAGTCGSSPPRRPRTCWARRSWRSGGRRWSRAASTGCCWSPAGGECGEKFRRKERAERRRWVKELGKIALLQSFRKDSKVTNLAQIYQPE